MFETKKVRKLKEDICFWKQKTNELENEILSINKQNKELEKQISQKDDEIMNLQHVNKENEIMKRYYKLDEDPSPEVQAKVIADLRIHNIEYENLLNKIEECKRAMQIARTNYPIYPYYSPLR